MKAAVFKGVGRPLEIETLPDPTPGFGQVLVEVGRCGICGTDLHITSGHGPLQPADTVMGHEFVGTVIEVGAGVERLKIGDRVSPHSVIGCGQCQACRAGEPQWCPQKGSVRQGYGQYAALSEIYSLRLPAGLSLEDGALIEPLAVGLHGVDMAQMEPGARVLVIGAGPIGQTAVLWARQLGAGKIVAMARSRGGEPHAMEMGADAFVTMHDEVGAEIEALLGGLPDVVFECAGVPGVIARAIDWVRPRGTVVALGFCTDVDAFVPSKALFKEVRVQFAFVYSLKDYQRVADHLDAGLTAPRSLVTQTVSLAQLPEAFEALRGPNSQCKVMIDPWA